MINRIESELKRQQHSKLGRYNTEKIHLKQMAFHKCLKKNRWVFGGNYNSGTECGAVETVWLARGIHPYRPNKPDISCWVVSVSREAQREITQKKILEYIDERWIDNIVMVGGSEESPEHDAINYIVLKNVFGTNSYIGFKNCEMGLSEFQGASPDFVWFNEEPSEEIYEECRMRVLDKGGHVFGTMTSLKESTWVYDKIYKHNSSEVWCGFMKKDLTPIFNRCITVSSVMSVYHLKTILEDLPNDMPVVIPARVDENYNILTNCVAVGTAGILNSPYEAKKVLCLNAIASRADTIADQVNDTMECEMVLF